MGTVYIVIFVAWLVAVMLPLGEMIMNRKAKDGSSRFADPQFRLKVRIALITVSTIALFVLLYILHHAKISG